VTSPETGALTKNQAVWGEQIGPGFRGSWGASKEEPGCGERGKWEGNNRGSPRQKIPYERIIATCG